MKKIIFLLTIFIILFTLSANDLGSHYPGRIIICFSASSIRSNVGDIDITTINGIVQTPFEWFNTISTEFEITSVKQLYKVKNRDWHKNGIYPMNVYSVQIENHSRTNELLESFKSSPDILFAEYDIVMKRQTYTPNDPFLDQQWAIKAIEAEKAWALETGSRDVIIGVVDSGVKWTHPDLRANIWTNLEEYPDITLNWETGEIIGGDGTEVIIGWDFAYGNIWYNLGESNNPYQQTLGNQHGTHVSGCVAAVGDNNLGIAGPAYSSTIMATKHAFTSASTIFVYNAYEGVYFCVDNGAHIINCSWGGQSGTNEGILANLAASYAKDHGVLMIVAAGNENSDNGVSNFYPANAEDVFSVAATDINDRKATFSNYGANVGISAPGVGILSTFYGAGGVNNYVEESGTSMAAPIVAGVAALILSYYPDLSVDELIERLQMGADPIEHLNQSQYHGKLGAGRVNAFASLMIDKLPNVEIVSIDYVKNRIGELRSPHRTGDLRSPHRIDGVPPSKYVNGETPSVQWRSEIAGTMWRSEIAATDGFLPGETISFTVSLKNSERWLDALPTTATISTDSPHIEILKNTVQYADILKGETIASEDSFIIKIDKYVNVESTIDFLFSYQADAGTGVNYTYDLPFSITVNLNMDNWPLNTINNNVTSMMVFDITQDGNNEIIFVDTNNYLHVMNPNKEYLPGFPILINATISNPLTIVKSILSENIVYEILITTSNSLHKVNHLGIITAETEVVGTITTSAVAFDINNNGSEEIAIGTSNGLLYIFNNDLTIYQDENNHTLYPINLDSNITSLPLFVDFNKDGNIDILVNTINRQLHIFTAINGEQHEISPFHTNVNVISGMVAVENDNDVYLYILGAFTGANNLIVLDNKGIIKASTRINGTVNTLPIAADINKSKNLEFICITLTGNLYIYDENLNIKEGFPISLGDLVSQHPILVDVDNDGFQEILVLVDNGTIHAIKQDGTNANGYTLYYDNHWRAAPVFADVLNQEKANIIVSNSINLYNLNLLTDYAQSDYPMHAYNRNRNAVKWFDTPVNIVDEPIAALKNDSITNYPNPFNPSTTIVYDIANTGMVQIVIYNIKGQKVRTLVNEIIEAGVHYVEWNGVDDNGKNLSSGIYFYQLKTDAVTQTKRMLLLK